MERTKGAKDRLEGAWEAPGRGSRDLLDVDSELQLAEVGRVDDGRCAVHQ